MHGVLECCFCGHRANEVRALVAGANAAICNECVADVARKMGMLSPAEREDDTEVVIADHLPTSFVHRMELLGHPDQTYDMFLIQCLLDRLRSKHWNISFETARIARDDGFVRQSVAEGNASFVIDILVRCDEPDREQTLRVALEDEWAALTAANLALIEDKGTRDLLDPRLRSLGTYVSRRADHLCG